MNKEIVSIDQEMHNIKHLLEVVLKNQKEIKAHLWTDDDGDLLEQRKPIGKSVLTFQEQEADEYVNNVVKVKYAEKSEGLMMAEGFFDGVVLNYIKTQAITFVGQTLKKIFLEVSVDLAKWLMDEAKNFIINLYNKSTDEEKETFKNKIKEVFPESPLLEELN